MLKQMKRKRSNAREIRTRDKKIPIFKIQFYDHHFSNHHTLLSHTRTPRTERDIVTRGWKRMKRITRWHRLAASDERTNEATKLDARTKKKKDLRACKWRRGRETSRRERERRQRWKE